MALDVTVGGTATQSYATVAEADAYIAGRSELGVTGWANLDTAAKERRLMLAAELLDRLPFRGVRACREQARAFPRLLPRSPLLEYVPESEETFETWTDVVAAASEAGLSTPDVPSPVKDAQLELVAQVTHPMMSMEATSEASELGSARGIASVNLAGQIAIRFDPKTTKPDSAARLVLGDGQISPLEVVRLLLRPWLAGVRGRVLGGYESGG